MHRPIQNWGFFALEFVNIYLMWELQTTMYVLFCEIKSPGVRIFNTGRGDGNIHFIFAEGQKC